MNAPYRSTLSDRFGPDVYLWLRSGAWGACVAVMGLLFGVLEAKRVGAGYGAGLLWGAAGGVLCGAVVTLGGVLLPALAGGAVRRLVQPSSCAIEPDFSREQSLAMRGDVAGALASYERRIASAPRDVDARLRAAELYAGQGSQVRRAAELFRAARECPRVTSGQDVYASNRLIDLYLGPLADERAAVRELERLVERHPSSTAAAHGREALRRLREERAGP